MAKRCIQDCKCLIKENNIDLLCLIKTKLNQASLSSLFSSKILRLFQFEKSVNNFDTYPRGRILVKWNSNFISFMPLRISAQMIHGEHSLSNQISVTLSIIYAHNSARDRLELLESIYELASSINTPWLLMGDFNCNLYSFRKVGGNLIPPTRFLDFRNYLMEARLLDLSSSRLFFTWSNL